jgi:hypothetical protein
MNESDFRALPDLTRRLVLHLSNLGLDRSRIHGLFVMLGLYAGAPDTRERLDELFSHLDALLPLDRSRNIDEVVGEIYDGYERQVNEFCFRSGVNLDFRKINIPGTTKTVSIVYPEDEGLLRPSIKRIDNLIDASQLYDSFLQALGQPTLDREVSLLDAFTCGVFQMQLYAKSDISGARQIAGLIRGGLPLFLGRCFRSIIEGRADYFNGLTGEQTALLDLMQSMEITYAREMWAFQSRLFFYEQKIISGLNEVPPSGWHELVLDRGRTFSAEYPSQLAAFSQSGVMLNKIPAWGSEINNFDVCDKYLEDTWGFSGNSLNGRSEIFEYRALMVHLIYSSLTQSREVLH